MRKLGILVVDDDIESGIHCLTKICLSNLRINGYQFEFYNIYSGHEAQIFMKENEDKIAIILLDIVMEKEDEGLQLINFVRDVLGNDEVRIIIRTGQTFSYAPEQLILEYDIDLYLEKSITSKNFRQQVFEVAMNYLRLMKLK